MTAIAPPAGAAHALPSRASSARRAALYVVTLLWVLPLLAFTVAAVHADASPCVATDGIPCDDQGMVVATGVLTAVLLLPVGLVALFVVALLARGHRRPAVIAAVAAAAGLAVGLSLVGVGAMFLN